MKDIVITGKDWKRELFVFLGCLAVAVLVNAGAIIAYTRPWYELFTQVGFTLSIALGLYLFIGLFRFIALIIKKLR